MRELHPGALQTGAPHVHWPGELGKNLHGFHDDDVRGCGAHDEHAGLSLSNYTLASHPSFPQHTVVAQRLPGGIAKAGHTGPQERRQE